MSGVSVSNSAIQLIGLFTCKIKSGWLKQPSAPCSVSLLKPFITGFITTSGLPCCLFSNACLKAITGKDIIPKTLKWKDEESAYEAIKKYNGTLGKSVAKACKKAGMREIPKSFVQKGDLVIYKEENELVGIWDGYAVLTPTDDCLGVKNNVDILEVWRA